MCIRDRSVPDRSDRPTPIDDALRDELARTRRDNARLRDELARVERERAHLERERAHLERERDRLRRENERLKDDLEACLLYTSDAADDLLCVDLGGRRIIKKKKKTIYRQNRC